MQGPEKTDMPAIRYYVMVGMSVSGRKFSYCKPAIAVLLFSSFEFKGVAIIKEMLWTLAKSSMAQLG